MRVIFEFDTVLVLFHGTDNMSVKISMDKQIVAFGMFSSDYRTCTHKKLKHTYTHTYKHTHTHKCKRTHTRKVRENVFCIDLCIHVFMCSCIYFLCESHDKSGHQNPEK